jgi:hypothetical protein
MPAWLSGGGIVSWNAASVWDAMVQDLFKSQAPGRCKNSWEDSELDDSRRNYFNEVYDSPINWLFLNTTQPQLWYRDGWSPCKALHIKGSRRARQEAYSSHLRRWHWRVAGEQLIYSHVDRVSHGDNNTPWRYELNTVSELLIGSQLDNFTGSNIFDATRTLASLMTTTPGESLFLKNTGHSVHFERPAYLAKKIIEFLPAPASATPPIGGLSLQITCIIREVVPPTRRRPPGGPPHYGRILSVSGTEHTSDLPFSLTVSEVVALIDAGSEAFVLDKNGNKIPVHVAKGSKLSPYIATDHNPNEKDNLLSLPEC